MKTLQVLLLALAGLLSACGTGPAVADTEFDTGLAKVESVEVVMIGAHEVEVSIVAQGYLPDGCTELHGSEQSLKGRTVKLQILTRRPKGAICTMALKYFKETYAINTRGLAPGRYQLKVNGLTGEFTLY